MSTVNYLTARSSNLAAFNTIRLNVSTLTGSTIQTTATATTSSIVVSTLTTQLGTYSTLTGSSITSNTLALSTLTVSSINSGAPGVAAYSTLNVSSLNTSSITTSSIVAAPGYNSNISNILYTSLADSGQTAANFTTSGMPALAPSGTVISGSYRATAGASSGAIGIWLGSYAYTAGTTYNFTFTGMQGSQALALYVYQYNTAGNSSVQISANVYSITTSAATVSGSFTANLYPVTYTGSIIFYFQAGAVNQYVNFTSFSMNAGAMNVGIGTSTPSYLVDMYGSNPTLRIRTSTGAYSSGTSTILFDSITTQYPLAQIRAIDMGVSPNVYRGDLVFYYQYNTTLTEGMRLTNTGNLGVGTSPTYQIDTPGYIRATSGLLAGNGTAATSLQLFDLPAASWQITTGGYNLSINNNSASWTNRLTINQSGQVGIGTPSPSQALDVMGSIRSNSTGNNASIIMTSTYGAFGSIECYNYNNVNTKLSIGINAYGGNVGIGLTNPSQKLEVSGTVKATGYNLSGYTMLIPKVVYVGSQVLNGVFSSTTNASGTASFPVIIGAYSESTIEGAFRSGSNPDTSQYFKAYYITAQITNQNTCQVGVAINNTVLASGITYSSPSFMIIIQSGYFLNWTQFPTQGAYGYQGNGLNLQVYQANTSVTNFQVNYITVHCVYLHTSYTSYPTVSGLTYNSSYQQFT